MRIGIVVIGRNEANCLERTLAVLPRAIPTIYVDSASEDNSVDIAKAAAIESLVLTRPPALNAARGRNAGVACLLDRHPEIEAIQMIDGDCELMSGWLESAIVTLESNETVAAVCGQLRERHPEISLYNRLCDREWRIPPGTVEHCGGNAMYRVSAFTNAGGFDCSVSAGEEPDLCFRLRKAGWRILAITQPMAIHDADMKTFSQWWVRMQRGGGAFADLARRYGKTGDASWRRQLISMAGWLSLFPVSIFGAFIVGTWTIAAVLVVYALQIGRMALRELRGGASARQSWEIASMTMLGKLPQTIGALRVFFQPR